ncbi:MAG: YhbY family RNA-binding protein [Smithellaceae bacterium]|nr:YhbY family RNA-binding protein [Smithellaceae bacterium]
MEGLKGSQKKYLRGLAHAMKPIVWVGKQGVTPDLVSSLDQALCDHELVKVKFNDFKEEKKEIAAELEAKLKCALAGMIGHVCIFYREQPDKDRRKIIFPR